MKNLIISLIGLLFCFTWYSCEESNEIQTPATTRTYETGKDIDFFSLLRKINLDIRQSENYSIPDLFNKYDLIVNEFNDYKYAKAAKAQIIMFLADKVTTLSNDQIVYLIKEINKFDMAYPKQNYLLINEANIRGIMTANEIQENGRKAYEKALAKAYIWQSDVKEIPTSPSENSYTSDVHSKNMDRAYYTEKLRIYSSGRD